MSEQNTQYTVALVNVATGSKAVGTVIRSGVDWLTIRLPGRAQTRVWRHVNSKRYLRGAWRLEDHEAAKAIPVDSEEAPRDRNPGRIRSDRTPSWWSGV